MWRRDDGGVEHVRVSMDDARDAVAGDGVVAFWSGDSASRVRYRVVCDAGWRLREVMVNVPESGGTLLLRVDAGAGWRDASGAVIAQLSGCVDVDLEGVVFTNTLPVRRLAMDVGDAREIDVAYVELPSLAVLRMPQRYTRVAHRVYRYESVGTDFRADLGVDGDGLVVDYPGLARRLWASPAQ
jgi:hypothetical protein